MNSVITMGLSSFDSKLITQGYGLDDIIIRQTRASRKYKQKFIFEIPVIGIKVFKWQKVYQIIGKKKFSLLHSYIINALSQYKVNQNYKISGNRLNLYLDKINLIGNYKEIFSFHSILKGNKLLQFDNKINCLGINCNHKDCSFNIFGKKLLFLSINQVLKGIKKSKYIHTNNMQGKKDIINILEILDLFD